MRKNSEQDQIPFRTVLITMPPDDPTHVANLARVLHHEATAFKLTILGYKPKSVLSLFFRDPIIGLPMPGFAAEQFIKYGHGEVPEHCRKICEHLEDLLLKDTGIEISYINGCPRRVINSLKPMFDLIVFPRSFAAQSIKQNVLNSVDLCFRRTRKIPILFWSRPKKWRRIIIIKAKNDIDYEETPVKNFLMRFVGEIDQEKQIEVMPVIAYQADGDTRESELLSPYGTSDIHEMPQKERAITVLVVSSKIARSFLRFRRKRDILRNWPSSVLIFPF